MKRWLMMVMIPGLLMAALPTSGNYKLDSYGFGSGGTAGSDSSNYSVNGLAGEQAGSGASTNYKAGAGEAYLKQANVPTITFSNDDRWYNKLKLIIGPEANPSDTKFAVAISTDNFVTTQYVKSDLTVGATLTLTDYLTYAGWGSTTGSLVRGLLPNTVYTVKAKAYSGAFTESGYGPTATASTQDPQLTFDIDVAATDISTNPPYQIDFGTLPVSTVTDTPQLVWVSLDTNGESGGKVYVSAQNSGLKSLLGSYTISSLTGNLAAQPEGFGAQGLSATQVSAGPLALVSPYNGSGSNIGVTDALIREIFTSANPIVSGRGSFVLKAKTKPLTPASSDYTEILTVIAAGGF